MNFRLPILLLLQFFVSTIFCQEKSTLIRSTSTEKLVFLDSIKKTFKIHDASCRIDSLWMKELSNKDLFDTVESTVAKLDVDAQVDYDLPTDLLKSRLKEMDAKSPFNIEWNQGLENTIKQFLKNRKKSFERLMAISEYYFPQFEEALAKENVPLEIKYLAVVESALNPRAVSKMGATGLWQFMYHTGKNYGLNITSYTDERSDPLLASKAAAAYMKNMYKIFGDWDLVLASYNSGPGNVTKAIRRADGKRNFWNIRKFLPRETQGYVPAFLATMYIYEYHKSHGILPQKAVTKHFETDTIMVKQQLNFKQISDLMDVPVAQLQFMNPQYKTDVIPFYKNTNHFLRMPTNKIAAFASNEEKIYAYANYEFDKREKQIFPTQENLTVASKIEKTDIKSVNVADLQKTEKETVLNEKNSRVTAAEQLPQGNVLHKKSESKNVFYEVQAGDNLQKIAKKYDVTQANLQLWNGLKTPTVMQGEMLQVSKEIEEKTIAQQTAVGSHGLTHIVQKGENLWKIADMYGLTGTELQLLNNLKNNHVSEKMVLVVAKTKAKKSSFVVAKNDKKIKKSFKYSVVKGDTLIEIADKFPGVTVAELRKWNNIKNNNLRPGMKLKVQG